MHVLSPLCCILFFQCFTLATKLHVTCTQVREKNPFHFFLFIPSNSHTNTIDTNSVLFINEAKPVTGKCPMSTASLRFKSSFGISVEVYIILWNMLLPQFDEEPQPPAQKHLLWALYFLKSYSTESLAAGVFGTSGKTFRKHTHSMIMRISSQMNSVVSDKILELFNHFSIQLLTLQ